MTYKNDTKRLIEHRAFILRMQGREKRPPARNVKIMFVPMSFITREKSDLFIVVYRPSNLKKSPYPTLFHIRGTGFNSTARYYSYITCSHLAEKSGCQVIDLDHHLAPEYPFPRPFNDVYFAYKFIVLHASIMKIDVSRIAVSGYSSGGNLTALMTIQAKEDKLPVAVQILISPILDLSRRLKKYADFENKDSFPNPLVDWFIKLYLQNNFHLPFSAKTSPFWSNSLINLPPTYFLFGEYDRFRSDSEMFCDKLNQLGLWAHKSAFKKENHAVFWKNMSVIEVMSAQLKMSFNLTKVPRPIFSKFLTNECSPKFTFFSEEENDKSIVVEKNLRITHK